MAFLCFNRLFGDWLKSNLPNNIAYCGNIDRVVYDFLSNHSERFRALPQDQRECDGWRERNIQWAVEALDGHEEWKVDYLILDEAQDEFMLTEDALQFYNSLLRGGLQAGQWMILGDFSRQVLYGYREAVEAAVNQLLAQQNVARIAIKFNCRNTTQIARFTYTLAGFGAQEVRPNLRNIGDIPVTVRRYWEGEQANVLRQQLDLVLRSVTPSDIMILSPKPMEQSVCGQINDMPQTKYRIYRKRENRPTPQDGVIDIPFATIREFKGLESPCVIVCDVDRQMDDLFRCELYVGLSRAVARLVVLARRGVDLAVIDELREQGIVE